MEQSRSPKGVRKGKYVDLRPQYNWVRWSSLEEIVEHFDRVEEDERYVDSVKVARAEQRERALARKLGRSTGGQEDSLQEDLGVDE